MIRLFIAGLMVLMASNANAFTNESLYKYCKSFTNNDFLLETTGDAACLAYFRGISDILHDLCIGGKDPEFAIPEDTKSFLRFLGANQGDLNAPIQEYVNQMQANPKKWNQKSTGDVVNAFREIYPCE